AASTLEPGEREAYRRVRQATHAALQRLRGSGCESLHRNGFEEVLLEIMTDARFTKVLVFVNALVSLALILFDVYRKAVGANPLEYVTRTTGILTLIFLTITLAITPVRKIFKANSLIKVRRMVGLFAFFYGALHLLTYIWFDRFFNIRSTIS